VQGIGGAMLVPGSLAIISASFEEERRGRAIGTWSGFSGITAALGPVLGGYLVENVSWRAAFLINVPLAMAGLALASAVAVGILIEGKGRAIGSPEARRAEGETARA
jgi:MFS family permease